MRLLVPFATLRDETRAALEADGRKAEYVRVGPDTPEAYFELLRSIWAEGREFTVIEHDIVVYPGALAELEACSNPWCGKPYMLSTGVAGHCLGCTRFSEELVRAEPDAIEATAQLRHDDATGRRHYGRLDSRLREVLEGRGYTFCTHWPAVEHLNPAQVFRGAINCVRCGAPIPLETMMRMPPPYTHCSEEPWTPPKLEPTHQSEDGTNTILVSTV